MNNELRVSDYIVFLVYFIIVASYGYWVYRKKKQATVSASHDYFLAEGSLTWWAIGASLIASNISAEQFIGMSGSGFKIGLAISTYEWMAAATLIIVAVFFCYFALFIAFLLNFKLSSCLIIYRYYKKINISCSHPIRNHQNSI